MTEFYEEQLVRQILTGRIGQITGTFWNKEKGILLYEVLLRPTSRGAKSEELYLEAYEIEPR